MTQTAMPTPQQIADAFSRRIRATLTAAEMVEVLKRNALETSENVCHTHDYIDANICMADALTSCGIQVFAADGHMPDSVCDLWNAAWVTAKANRFEDMEAIDGIDQIADSTHAGYTG
jgi:hypothetical protein